MNQSTPRPRKRLMSAQLNGRPEKQNRKNQSEFPAILLEALYNLPTGIILFKKNTLSIELINGFAKKLCGIPDPQFHVHSLTDFSTQVVDLFEDGLQKVLMTEKPVNFKSFSWHIPGAEDVVYCDLDFMPVKNALGELTGIVFTATEVTDFFIAKKSSEHKEKQLNQRLQLITDAMPLMIAYLDRNGKFLFVNKMMESWMGRSSEEICSKNLSEVFSGNTGREMEINMEPVMQGKLNEFKCVTTVNGQRKAIEVHYLPHLESNHTVCGFYAILIDITERRQITHVSPACDGKISSMKSSIAEMSSTISEISRKLDVARIKLKRAKKNGDVIDEKIKKWTSDLQVSEAMAVKVKTALEEWLSSAA